MNFRIHHVGLPLERPEQAFLQHQQQLGLQDVCTFVIPGKLVNYFSGGGSDVTIHSMGDPLYPYQMHYVNLHGRTWEHINFLVDDPEETFDQLIGKGCVERCEPTMMAHVRYASVGDPECDVIYEFMRFRDDDDLALGEVDVDLDVADDDLRLGQISLVTHDLRSTEARLADFFGLRTVYDHTSNDSGFILMADRYWNTTTHDFVVKIWGGPNAGTREQAILTQRGSLFDAVVFYAHDVEGAYSKTVAAGAVAVSPPRDDDVYGGTIAWIRDAEGNDIAITSDPPTAAMVSAFEAIDA